MDNEFVLSSMIDCNHYWKFIKDWEGDPTIPNGTRDCSYWVCINCGEITYEDPNNEISNY
jgi:hypothetical protein